MNSDMTLQTTPVIFHYDPNGIRKRKRRDAMCPPEGLDNWYDHHKCPKRNKQPPVVAAGGWVDINGQPQGEAFWGVPFPDSFQRGRASNNLIGETPTDYRGMYWSCDEWPAAS